MRAVGSQLVVDTIEDALRQGGLALFEEGFQFESSLNWIFGESIEGEVDVVVPLWSEGGQALFVQPGAVFWTGLAEEERIDGNFGAVYRTELFDSFIGGGSVFYDYDFQYGHSRLGAGVDLQSGLFQAGFNYYHPLDEWDEGRTDYEEQALRGVDFRIALEREVMRLGANLSYWRFEGEEDEKGDWKPSYGFDAGIRIVPGVFLEGGWEGHDETVSLDQRWNAGLAFRFSLPDFKGASYGEGGLSSNLWKFVEREKRILYEERLGIPRVNLSATQATPVVEPAAVGETETVTVEADLGKPLDEEVTLHVMIAETSTAVLGTDFTYGHRVYELDEATGEQSAPEGAAMPCPEDPMMACDVTIPAGVTRFDIEASISMTMEREVREFIDFQVEVSEEDKGLLRGSFVERVTIEAHGNEIMFATNAPTTLMENDERTGIQVTVSIDEPSPTPITLNVATRGTATAEVDYNISGTSLTIPANADSASLTLTGINNNVGEGSKTIELMLSGDLPTGWTITDGEHEVTLQDDDLAIFFTNATPGTVEEPDSGSTPVTVTVDITQAPMANITVRVADGGTGQTAQQGNNNDYTFSPTNLTFASGSDAPQTTTLMVLPDNDAETDQTIILTLADVGGSVAAEGSGFSLGGPHTITIPANDNTVSFTTDSATSLVENNTTTGVAVRVEAVQSAPVDITLNVAPSGTATVGTDYRISSRTLTIPANTRMSEPLILRANDNPDPGGNKQIVLTLTGNLPEGWDFASDPFTHMVTLRDDDSSVGFEFTPGSNTVDEPASNTDHNVTVRLTNSPDANVTLQVAVLAASSARSSGTNIDATLVTTSVDFAAGATGNDLAETVTINVKHDTLKEAAEFLTIRLNDMSDTLTTGGNNFSWGEQREYRLNIRASDNTISINSGMSDSTVVENATSPAEIVVSVDDHASPGPITLNVSVTSSSTPPAVAGTDYTVPGTLTIDADSRTGTLEITPINDELEEGDLVLDVTLTGNNLPTGWGLVDSSGNSATSLTHSLTITDDERLTVRWASGNPTSHTAPATGLNTLTLTAEISSAPSQSIDVGIRFSGPTQGPDYTFIGVTPTNDSCAQFNFPAGATTSQLTQTCKVLIRSNAAGDTATVTLVNSFNENIVIDSVG